MSMSTPPKPTPSPDPSHPGVDDGTCELMGPPALIVQALMGVMVVLTLVYKRQHEKPRRKWRIWTFDVSKQLVGQVVVHFSNVFLSALIAYSTVQNPCVLYFLNIVVDTTIGVGILYLLLWGVTKVLTEQFHLNGLQSGQYGDGPKPSIQFWARQAAVYVVCLLLMKVAVVLLFAIWPGIFDIGEWILSWTGKSDWVQVVFVMGVCPIIFNMLQFWLIDSIVKARDSLNLGTPIIAPADGTQEPLFSNDHHDSDTDDDSPRVSRRRRSPDLEAGRGVSPLKLSPSHDITNVAANNSSENGDDKTVTLSLPKKNEHQIKRRSPPPSPAPELTQEGESRDDDWAGWDDPEWDQEANNPWGENGGKGKAQAKGDNSKRRSSGTRSPKLGSRSLSSNTTRTRMEVINTTPAVR